MFSHCHQRPTVLSRDPTVAGGNPSTGSGSSSSSTTRNLLLLRVRTSFPSLFLQLSLPYFLSSFFLFSCLFLPLGEGVRGVGKNEMRAQMIAIHHMLISANGTKTVSIILELTAKLT